MEFVFKNVEEKDLEEIKNIYQYYVDNTTATFHMGEISIKEIRDMFFSGDDLYEGFKVVNGDEIVGYVYISPYKKRDAYKRSAEVTLYFKESVVGKGLGKKALNFIEEVARKKGIKTLLSVICAENDKSTKLFHNMNYEKCAHLKGVGEKFNRVLDIVIYQKDII